MQEFDSGVFESQDRFKDRWFDVFRQVSDNLKLPGFDYSCRLIVRRADSAAVTPLFAKKSEVGRLRILIKPVEISFPSTTTIPAIVVAAAALCDVVQRDSASITFSRAPLRRHGL